MHNLASLDRPLSKLHADLNDVGVGYRRLQNGERIQAGDEFHMSPSDVWSLTSNVGYFVNSSSLTYRRKVEQRRPTPCAFAGEGYRFLKAGERFQEGDECVHMSTLGNNCHAISGVHYGQAVRPTTSAAYPEGYYRRRAVDGNAIFVRHDGFSRPMRIEPAYGFGPMGSERLFPHFFETYEHTPNMGRMTASEVASSFNRSAPVYTRLQFRDTGRSDGFGRRVYEQI